MNAKILNNEQTKLIVILLAVVMLFFSYQFGFSRYNDKTAAINEENKTLKEKQEELQGLVDKQTIYEDGITKYSKLIEEFTDRYGAGISIDNITGLTINLFCKLTYSNTFTVSNCFYFRFFVSCIFRKGI